MMDHCTPTDSPWGLWGAVNFPGLHIKLALVCNKRLGRWKPVRNYNHAADPAHRGASITGYIAISFNFSRCVYVCALFVALTMG